MSLLLKARYHWLKFRSYFRRASAAGEAQKLVICTVFKDEAPFLKEWLDFHFRQGVDHVLLIDNFSSDQPHQVLKDYLDQGKVSLLQTRSPKMSTVIQARELNRGVRHLRINGFRNCWCAFIDVDEFLYSTGHSNLKEVLQDFSKRKTGAVLANWMMFGTSHLQDIDPARPMLRQFTLRAPDKMHSHRMFKPITWLPNVLGFTEGPHLPVLRKGAEVYYSNGEVFDPANRLIVHQPLRINHYWYRSENYYRQHKKPRRLAFAPPREAERERTHYEACNSVEDLSILRLLGPED